MTLNPETLLYLYRPWRKGAPKAMLVESAIKVPDNKPEIFVIVIVDDFCDVHIPFGNQTKDSGSISN